MIGAGGAPKSAAGAGPLAEGGAGAEGGTAAQGGRSAQGGAAGADCAIFSTQWLASECDTFGVEGCSTICTAEAGGCREPCAQMEADCEGCSESECLACRAAVLACKRECAKDIAACRKACTARKTACDQLAAEHPECAP
jgi:hypothetical protein